MITNTRSILLAGAFCLVALTLTACGGDDNALESLDAKFFDITRGMTMDEVNKLVGEPEKTEPLEDSGGGMISTWPQETRVLYDSRKQVTAVIHNGVSLDLE